jgi:hypothetical protein
VEIKEIISESHKTVGEVVEMKCGTGFSQSYHVSTSGLGRTPPWVFKYSQGMLRTCPEEK